MNFKDQVSQVLDEISKLLISKNIKYGNSAIEPLGIFSDLSPEEGLKVRIDDKLKRIKNGSLDKDDEDVINDLIGYLVLLKILYKKDQKEKQRDLISQIMASDQKDGLYDNYEKEKWDFFD